MPTVQKVHIDRVLSNISVGYTNEQFIADQVFPELPVTKQSDKYYIYGMERFRVNNDLRAPGTEANEIDWTLSNDQYFCEGHALRHAIPIEEEQNADEEFNLQAEGTELITEGILLNKEVDAASRVMDSENYLSTHVVTLGSGGTLKWSDPDSDPIVDIQKAKEIMHRTAGIRPNTMIMSERVMSVLKLHPRLVEIIKYVQRGIVTEELLATAFGIKKFLVGAALKSTVTNPGQAAPGAIEPLDYIWGNNIVLAYIAPKPSKKQPSLGYSFMWNKDGNGSVQVRKWWEEGRKSTIIEAERWYSQRITSNVCGFMFADAVVPLGSF